jgi:hypothetical protein
MSSGKMERYNVTGLVNNGRLVGRFPFCLKIKWNTLISGMLFLYFKEFDTAAQISSFSIRQNKSRLENLPFWFWWWFLFVEDWKAVTWLGNVLMECKNFKTSRISILWTTSRDCPKFSKQNSRN